MKGKKMNDKVAKGTDYRGHFVKECKGALKGAGDAVKLLHKKSPFR